MVTSKITSSTLHAAAINNGDVSQLLLLHSIVYAILTCDLFTGKLSTGQGFLQRGRVIRVIM